MRIKKILGLLVLFIFVVALAVPSATGGAPTPPPIIDVTNYGAKGNGSTDDTGAIQKALAATVDGSVLFFPTGKYVVTREILITKRVSLLGLGQGSQIFQSTNGENLFHLSGTQAVFVRDLYLGSASTLEGTSLIRLTNSHHVRVDNVIMLGGYYGVHLKSSLLNTFTGLRTGTNFGGFFTSTSVNQIWVFGERFNSISSNANTFVAPALEGGTNGILLTDTNSEGSISIYGGTIEGVANEGLRLQGTGLPSVISALHMEANGNSDITLAGASRVRIESVLATKKIELSGTSLNNTVSESMVEKIAIGSDARRTRLISLAMNLSGTSSPAVEDNATDTQYSAVSSINPFDWFGTVGIGVTNPNSNPVGLTPNLSFRYWGHSLLEGRQTSMAMFEDERGLYPENVRIKEVSRIFFESDLAEVNEKLRMTCFFTTETKRRK